ncbi:contractile injection system tape measure protein [Chitinophaga pollutisoli]|uniref:Contractile injection system tape measure protein n=1 Tax=Chitinophaga pollutisoli TaxID=3133966 RepID=A0ABZ2YJA2_9BACT
MSKLRHMIHRQLFELTAQTGHPAWEWDRTTADFHHDLLLPVLEACFLEAGRQDEHLVIDRLEIDLGVFAGRESFSKEAGGRLRERLVPELRAKRQEAAARGSIIPSSDNQPDPANGYAVRNTTSRQEDPATGSGAKKKRREIPAALMDTAEASLAAYLFFLAEGRLPWWFEHHGEDCFGKDFQAGLTTADLQRILKIVEERLVQAGKDEIMEWMGRAAGIRCVMSLDDELLIRMAVAKGWNEVALRREWEMLQSPAQQFPAFFPAFRQRYWMLRLHSLFAGEPAYWEVIFPPKATPVHLLALVHGEAQKSGDAILAGYLASKLETLPHHEETTSSQKENTVPAAVNISGKRKDRVHSGDNKQLTAEEDGLYVESAGLVLLHPFLSELFISAGLRKNGEWAPLGQQTAVRLLGYLSDGDENLPEYRLIFQKILAGLLPEEPLEAIAPPAEELLASCNELLDAVLGHWSALKGTSRDGLREGFLQRPAMLRIADNGMQLEMEKRAQDVLIGRLPWSCSLVRMSWMEQLIAVNWI